MAGRKSGASDWLTEDSLLLIEGWAREALKQSQAYLDKAESALSSLEVRLMSRLNKR